MSKGLPREISLKQGMASWWNQPTNYIKIFVTLIYAVATTRATDNRHVFNPRMDYEEWKPLGRGDPLKNDPTYDYVPPVLDHVYYWIDPSKRTPDPPLPTESRTESEASSRLDTMGLLDPFFKIIDVSKVTFGLGGSTNYRPTPTVSHYVPLQRPPHLELMPPPPPPIRTTESPLLTSFATTLKSSTHSPEEMPTSSALVPTTETLANTENLYKPVAINMPNKTEEEPGTDPPTDFKAPSAVMMPPRNVNFHIFQSPTTTQRALTTDPIFKHYKQPSKPIKGPFYLIIQGHSKVKTYGAGKSKINMHQPLSSNEISFEDGRSNEEEELPSKFYRKSKKLPQTSLDEGDVLQSHSAEKLSSSYKRASFTIDDDGSRKVKLVNTDDNDIISHNILGRKLLQATETSEASTLSTLDKQQLHLESLIALNDDYREEEVINLLLKEEGQGSGLGGLVASLLKKARDEV